MSRNGKVIVAMSGGVDSSVTASLLRDAGYDCTGVFIRVGAHAPEPETCPTDTSGDSGGTATRRRLKHGCCSAEDAIDARAVAARLGIPFYALNFEKDFDRIIDYFVDEYASARTPNPCVMCNIHVKFGKLLRYAELMDAGFVATGHYARVLAPADGDTGTGEDRASLRTADGRGWRLARALNRQKDQSYVLFGIRRDDLPRCLFPLGEIADKAEVRRIAAGLGLRVHDKPDSQEICFVPGNDYKQLVRARRPDAFRAGDLHGPDGGVVGRHEGVAAYTIGQRRGLGVALGEPAYVARLDVLNNTVTLGTRDALRSAGLVADGINWLSDPPPGPRRAWVKIRHMHTPAPATVRVVSGGCGGSPNSAGHGSAALEARFDEPQLAVTPGQAAVFYDEDDCVLAGGWIREALP